METHLKADELSIATPKPERILVVGIGSAASSVLQRTVAEGGDAASLVLMDTDLAVLSASGVARHVQLGKALTYGLPAGGDPALGHDAAREASHEIGQVFQKGDLVFLCAGLGGGTASGALPVIARLAKEAGCFVLVFVTLPFPFEGKRRFRQAQDALEQTRPFAEALLIFENDQLAGSVVPDSGVREAFALADATICHSIRAIASMLERPRVIKVGKQALISVLNRENGRCLFGFGRASGPERALGALRVALDNPALGGGKALESAVTVLVHITGNTSVTLMEVEEVMTAISTYLDPATEVVFGVSASDALDDEIWVAVIGSVVRGAAPDRNRILPEPVQASRAPAVSPPVPLVPFQTTGAPKPRPVVTGGAVLHGRPSQVVAPSYEPIIDPVDGFVPPRPRIKSSLIESFGERLADSWAAASQMEGGAAIKPSAIEEAVPAVTGLFTRPAAPKAEVSLDESKATNPRENSPSGSLIDKSEARKLFALEADRFTVLVVGQGAQANGIHAAATETLRYFDPSLVQFLHLAGPVDIAGIRAAYARCNVRAHVGLVTEDLERACAASDLAICAATGEGVRAISKSALPAILISPAGIAAGELSAQAKDFIASGACLGKKEEELTALELARMVATLGMDSARLREMRHRMETARSKDGVAVPQR